MVTAGARLLAVLCRVCVPQHGTPHACEPAPRLHPRGAQGGDSPHEYDFEKYRALMKCAAHRRPAQRTAAAPCMLYHPA